MYLAYDMFTVLRYFHVFHEDTLDKLLKWTDKTWILITAFCIFLVSLLSVITAAIEILPNYKSSTYDLVIYFFQGSQYYRANLALNICQILYTLTIIGN